MMFIGANTNIKHKGKIFHIQTEDGGLDQHTLTTILFKNGAILSSRKTSYIDIPKSPTYAETIKEMMQEQHKQMMRDLVSGKFENDASLSEGEEKADAEAKQVSETNKVSKKAPITKDVKEEAASVELQRKPAQKSGLDFLISDYLAKKDATRV